MSMVREKKGKRVRHRRVLLYKQSVQLSRLPKPMETSRVRASLFNIFLSRCTRQLHFFPLRPHSPLFLSFTLSLQTRHLFLSSLFYNSSLSLFLLLCCLLVYSCDVQMSSKKKKKKKKQAGRKKTTACTLMNISVCLCAPGFIFCAVRIDICGCFYVCIKCALPPPGLCVQCLLLECLRVTGDICIYT